MCKSWAEQDRRMETIPRFGRCKTTRVERHGGVAERRSFWSPRKKGQAEYRLRGGGRTLLPSSGEAVWKAREGYVCARRGASWSAHTYPRNARPQKTRGTAIVLSAGAAKSARGSPHDRTCPLPPISPFSCPLPARSLFAPFRRVILLLGPG